MITGYNTDIKHGNRVFHVQTEDNGRSNPSIVTLIYVGGEILASRKSSYAEIPDINEKAISELMENQHRRMISAVKKGKFDGPNIPADPLADEDTDVSSAPPMISTTAVARKTSSVPRPTEGVSPAATMLPGSASPTGRPPAVLPYAAPPPPVAGAVPPSQARTAASAPAAAAPPVSRPPAPTLGATHAAGTAPPPPAKAGSAIPISDRTLDQVIIDYLASESTNEHLELSLGNMPDVCGGDQVEMRIVARTSISQEPIVGAEVVVKVISTVDKPVVAFRGKTTGDGSCIARFKVPDYPEGNSAIIVTASSPHGNDEVKQLVKRRR